jgi:ketosteroid isomerase-like protein
MSQSGPAALLRAYYHALDLPDLDQLDALFDEQSVWEFPGARLQGLAAIKRQLGRSLATGVRMEHAIGHLLEAGDVAICELEATNTLGDRTFVVRGAVVCEARDGRIARICAYPDAAAATPFFAAMAAARSQQGQG